MNLFGGAEEDRTTADVSRGGDQSTFIQGGMPPSSASASCGESRPSSAVSTFADCPDLSQRRTRDTATTVPKPEDLSMVLSEAREFHDGQRTALPPGTLLQLLQGTMLYCAHDGSFPRTHICLFMLILSSARSSCALG